MQVKLGENLLVVGTSGKDAELKTVGDKQSPVCKFSVAAGKRDDKTIWVDCEAWHKLAQTAAASIKKGDAVLAVGKIKSHEYNGKTYNTLVCDFVCNACAAGEVVPSAAPAAQQDKPADSGESDFIDIGGDEKLPF